MTETSTLNFLKTQKLNNSSSSSFSDVNSSLTNSPNQQYKLKLKKRNSNKNSPNLLKEFLNKNNSNNNANSGTIEDTYSNLKKESIDHANDCILEEVNESISSSFNSQKLSNKKIHNKPPDSPQKQSPLEKHIKRNSHTITYTKNNDNLKDLNNFLKDYKKNKPRPMRFSIANTCSRNSFSFLLSNDHTCFGRKIPKISSRGNLPCVHSNKSSKISTQNRYKSFLSEESASKANIYNFHKNNNCKHLDGHLKLTQHKRLLISTFNYTKSNYLYKETEKLINIVKIFYTFLIIFSLTSIICSVIDGKLFIDNSEKYLIENDININSNNKDINIYYLLKNRKITKKENMYRIINGITSIINCFLLFIIRLKSVRFVNIKRKTRTIYTDNEPGSNNQYINQIAQHKKEKKIMRQASALKTTKVNIVLSEDDDIVNESVSLSGTKFRLVFLCIINIIFYPPFVNKIYIGYYHQILYVFPLNSIFMIITFFKIINIYLAIIFISPINSIPNKLICKSNLFSLRNIFVIKIMMNDHPIIFAIINTIVMFFITTSIMYFLEYFSIDKNLGIYSNKGENNFKNYLNVLYLYIFFIKKTAFGDIHPRTLLGKFIITIFQSMGSFLLAFLFFHLNSIIEFKVEEQRAYSRLMKLFDPENKEYKATTVISKLLKLKKLYKDSRSVRDAYFKLMYSNKNIDYVKLMDQKFKMDSTLLDNKNSNNIDESHYVIFGLPTKKQSREIKSNENLDLSKTIFSENEVGDNKEDIRKKIVFYMEHYFVIKTRFIIAIKEFTDNFKIASSFSIQLNDAIFNLENKLADNTQELNSKLFSIEDIDEDFEQILYNHKRFIKRFKRLNFLVANTIIYLVETNNKIFERRLHRKKKQKGNGMNTTIKSAKKAKGNSKKLTEKQLAEYMPKKLKSGFVPEKRKKQSIEVLDTIVEGEEKIDEVSKNE